MPGAGPGVAAGLLPAILFGGVLGAGCGTVLLYAGAMEEDPSIENIFAEESKPAAHSVQEPAKIKIPSASERRSAIGRGFAARFL
mmetsp:Transcript_39711/g.88230  ORF Transcript_39711/g.88230 Transcript_39711/m.88230 type:complete len:85 (+) Transcript_39711:120-374(+)|eukprot:CAMPEP_0202894844 /NCGR_PEP_ID=MMETSP1392-20130828/4150_1 /ASSEMBLY_ACC=CAM_ASM_000868 /TAXON_ID=225041 /ORGANISM="Chlamydomonas chlamydogama, Strain SAG 11-48b" /LENGTH=84 /DNA_ID=CAMNT_0049579653 /DNA_START=96 /DNA_END=350 /DNA_ORIENTATION=-